MNLLLQIPAVVIYKIIQLQRMLCGIAAFLAQDVSGTIHRDTVVS